jgi:hypothetical protein
MASDDGAAASASNSHRIIPMWEVPCGLHQRITECPPAASRRRGLSRNTRCLLHREGQLLRGLAILLGVRLLRVGHRMPIPPPAFVPISAKRPFSFQVFEPHPVVKLILDANDYWIPSKPAMPEGAPFLLVMSGHAVGLPNA